MPKNLQDRSSAGVGHEAEELRVDYRDRRFAGGGGAAGRVEERGGQQRGEKG
jgi:hypothetical protein